MTTNERQNAYKTNKNFNGHLVQKKYNKKKSTRKKNKATKRGRNGAMKRAIALKESNDTKISKTAKQYN